jgi:hypothetical protein
VSLAFNAQHEPAHGTPATDVKPDQFAANLRHVGMNTRGPSQNGNPSGHGGVHGTPFAPHSVIVITKCGRHEEERFHNRATGNARA